MLFVPSQKATPTNNASADKAKRPRTSSARSTSNTSRALLSCCCVYVVLSDFVMLLVAAVKYSKYRECVWVCRAL